MFFKKRLIFFKKNQFWRRTYFYLIFLLIIVFAIGLIFPPGENIESTSHFINTLIDGHLINFRTRQNPPFACLKSNNLLLYLPVKENKLVGLGYHQAQNKRALEMVPQKSYPALKVDNPINYDKSKKAVIMKSRGRGTSFCSAVDIAAEKESVIFSPVTGKITKIKEYYLYNRYPDYHIEIRPDRAPEVRIVLIHIKNLNIKKGQRVIQGTTKLGIVRSLSNLINSQIIKYYGSNQEHLHIQVNPVDQKGHDIRS